jgi:hypothetical protein
MKSDLNGIFRPTNCVFLSLDLLSDIPSETPQTREHGSFSKIEMTFIIEAELSFNSAFDPTFLDGSAQTHPIMALWRRKLFWCPHISQSATILSSSHHDDGRLSLKAGTFEHHHGWPGLTANGY